MTAILTWIEAQHSPGLLVMVGVAAVIAALALLRLVRRVRRLIWTASVLALASGMGAGGGWTVLDALGKWR